MPLLLHAKTWLTLSGIRSPHNIFARHPQNFERIDVAAGPAGAMRGATKTAIARLTSMACRPATNYPGRKAMAGSWRRRSTH